MNTVVKKIAAVARAAAATGGVAKTQKNPQGWSYRGIEQIMNLLGPLMAQEGLVILTRVEEVSRREVGKARETCVKVTYEVTDGESVVTTSSVGTGIDFSDKSDAKALTMSLKSALVSLFLLPYGSTDGDAESPVIETPEPPPKQPEPTRRKSQIPALPEPDPKAPASKELLRQAFQLWKEKLQKQGAEEALKREFLEDLPQSPSRKDVEDLIGDLEELP